MAIEEDGLGTEALGARRWACGDSHSSYSVWCSLFVCFLYEKVEKKRFFLPESPLGLDAV